MVTAWFEVDGGVVEASLSPDLMPSFPAPYRVRLRFYELDFEALGENAGQFLAPSRGHFREAAVGFPARAGAIDGDMSVYMWADSDTYVMWAREAFGWPLLRGAFDFFGDAWSRSSDLVGASGGARLTDEWGTAEILEFRIAEQSEPVSLTATWVTPRRILHRAGRGGETRELQVVRPETRRNGERYAGTGRVSFEFREPHPLSRFGKAEADVDVVDGFELLVGDDVEII